MLLSLPLEGRVLEQSFHKKCLCQLCNLAFQRFNHIPLEIIELLTNNKPIAMYISLCRFNRKVSCCRRNPHQRILSNMDLGDSISYFQWEHVSDNVWFPRLHITFTPSFVHYNHKMINPFSVDCMISILEVLGHVISTSIFAWGEKKSHPIAVIYMPWQHLKESAELLNTSKYIYNIIHISVSYYLSPWQYTGIIEMIMFI